MRLAKAAKSTSGRGAGRARAGRRPPKLGDDAKPEDGGEEARGWGQEEEGALPWAVALPLP